MVGRDLVELVGDEGHLSRVNIEYEVDELLFAGIAFDIKFGADNLFDRIDVFVPDMAFIGSWMDGDTVSAKALGINGCLDDIGVVATAAVAERSKFVDVYGEPGHAAKVTKRGGTG